MQKHAHNMAKSPPGSTKIIAKQATGDGSRQGEYYMSGPEANFCSAHDREVGQLSHVRVDGQRYRGPLHH
jgi:hypothetical protein